MIKLTSREMRFDEKRILVHLFAYDLLELAKIHENQRWLRWFPFGGALGFTFGDHIFVYKSEATIELLAHEMVHVQQYKKHGILSFLLKYLVELGRVTLYRRPISEHKLEAPAYAIEDEARKWIEVHNNA